MLDVGTETEGEGQEAHFAMAPTIDHPWDKGDSTQRAETMPLDLLFELFI